MARADFWMPWFLSGWSVVPVVLLGLCVYLPALHNEFTNWDDDSYVTDNPTIRELSLDTVQTLFSQSYALIYVPLSFLSFALEYQVVGLQPGLYHLNNILLHVLNTVLVWLFVQRLIQRPRAAWAAAVLFAVHPMHVESVAWVSERKDVLYSCFFLLALLRYLAYVARPRWTTYSTTLLLGLLALLAKGQAVSLPLVLVLIDWYQARQLSLRANLLEKAPFFALSLVFGGIALLVGPLASDDMADSGRVAQSRLVLAGYAYGQYLLKLVVPYITSALYPEPPLELAWLVSGSVLGCAGLLVWHRRQVAPEVWFGLGFFSLNIVWLLQIVPLGQAYLADRFVYVGALGIFLIVGLSADWCFQQLGWLRRIALAVGLLYIAGLSTLSFQYTQAWKNSLTLWNDVIGKYDYLPVAYYSRGVTYMELNNARAAVQDYTTAIGLAPGYAAAYYNRGVAYMELNNAQAAVQDYTTAIGLAPGYVAAYLNRGIGRARLGQLQAAKADLDQAITLAPAQASGYTNRANVHYLMGNRMEAVADLGQAIAREPSNGMAYYNRGSLWQAAGAHEYACRDFRMAVELGVKAAQEAHDQTCR